MDARRRKSLKTNRRISRLNVKHRSGQTSKARATLEKIRQRKIRNAPPVQEEEDE